jgi:hypothetical protein
MKIIIALVLLATGVMADNFTVDFKPSAGASYYQINASLTPLSATNTWVTLRRLTNAPLVTLTNSYTGEIYQGIVANFTNQPSYLAFSASAVGTNGIASTSYAEPLLAVKNLRIQELP